MYTYMFHGQKIVLEFLAPNSIQLVGEDGTKSQMVYNQEVDAWLVSDVTNGKLQLSHIKNYHTAFQKTVENLVFRQGNIPKQLPFQNKSHHR